MNLDGKPEDVRGAPRAYGGIPAWLLQAQLLDVQKQALANQQPADRIAELLAKEAPPPGSAP